MFLRYRGRIAVALAFAVPLVVLLATVRTSVGYWDTGDLQTVAWIAGIPYPTGFPLYVIGGWVWTHAIPFASAAARLNALSAVAIAGGAAAVCAIALLCDVAEVLAVPAAWTFAFAFPVWFRATYADVHPLGFAVSFLAIVFALRWVRRGAVRDVVAAMLIAAVALGIDNTTVLILAGGVILTLQRPPPLRVAAGTAAAGALIVCAAYAFLPLRSAQVTAARLDPTLALGLPPGRPYWDDHHPASWGGFVALVGGTSFAPGAALANIVKPEAIVAAAERYVPMVGDDFPFRLLLAGPAGLALLAYRRPLVALGLAVAGVVPAIFGSAYRAEADPERYVFALYAVTALGVALAAGEIAGLLSGRVQRAAYAVLVLILVGVAVNEVVRGGVYFEVRADATPDALADRIVGSTSDRAIVVAPWIYASPLAYRAYVDDAFGARIVVCGWWPDYEKDYARWLRSRTIVIVSDDIPEIAGHHVRLLADGIPAVYELLP